MVKESKTTLFVDNLSSATRSSDVKKVFELAGTVYEVERDYKERCALVEFKRKDDAEYAWRKLDGKRVDGRSIKVDWATLSDFKMFGWKWTEDSPSPSRSRSASPIDSYSRGSD